MRLEILFSGKEYHAYPRAAVATSLVCDIPGFPGGVIVCEYQAFDKQAFWSAWRALGGESQNLVIGENKKPFIAPYALVDGDEDDDDEDEPEPRGFWRRLLDWLFPWTREASDD